MAVGDEGAAPEGLAHVALGSCQPEHDRERDDRQGDPDGTRVRPILSDDRPDRLEPHVRGENQEGRRDEARGATLDRLDPFLIRATNGLRAEPPDQDRPGDALDETVDAEADEGDAAGGEPSPDGDDALDDVPADISGPRIEEAVALREAHLEAPILAWLLEPRFVPAALARGIDVSASSTVDLEGIARAAQIAGRRARVHLKLDTGLHRAGVPLSAWLGVLRQAVQLESTRLLRFVGIWSHLSHGDVLGQGRTVGS